MSFKRVKLNDGRSIPGIGFGTWKIGSGETVVLQVDQAINTGFDHFDTAQAYGNEKETGDALYLSGLTQDDLWVTTKYSGSDPSLSIYESCKASLEKLQLKYVDLYLIHSPRLCKGDIPGSWKQMERLKKEGLAKSIGVSNFGIDDLKELLASAEILPTVNQIALHPYVWKTQRVLMEFQDRNGIATEGYSPLFPLTTAPGGPVDGPVNEIARRLGVYPEQVLIAWVKSKGAVVLTTSSKVERLERYLAAGHINLSQSDTDAIEKAGAEPRNDLALFDSELRNTWARLNRVALLLFSAYIAYHWLRIEFSEQREFAY